MRKDRRRVPPAVRRVRPDGKGRITLGSLARGVSSFTVRVDATGMILLEPFREVPARKGWQIPVPLTRSEVTEAVKAAAAGRPWRRPPRRPR